MVNDYFEELKLLSNFLKLMFLFLKVQYDVLQKNVMTFRALCGRR